jgi:hypothetical protein
MITLLVCLSGCASIRPAVVVETFGDSDPARDEAIAERAEDEDSPVPDVRVVSGAIPEGLSLSENNQKLIVEKGYRKRYRILGSVEADYERGAEYAFIKNYLWTWDYEEDWRKGLCYWQVPFKVLSLGIWSYLFPGHYPCFSAVPGDESERKAGLQAYLKRGAKAMGGNLVILVASQDLMIVTGGRGGVRSDVIQTTALKGFVLEVQDEAGSRGNARGARRRRGR